MSRRMSRQRESCSLLRLFSRVLMRLFLAGITGSGSAAEMAAQIPIAQMYHQSWTVRDGVPNNIEELVQGPDGFLWISTDGGLYKFDGVSFNRYTAPNGSSLSSNYLYRVIATKEGSIWVSYFFGGLSRIKNGQVTNFTEKDGLRSQQISVVAEGPDGSFWIGGTYGIQALKGRQWIDIKIDRFSSLAGSSSMATDKEGNFWITLAQDLVVIPSGSTVASAAIPTKQQLYCQAANDLGVWCSDSLHHNSVVHFQWSNRRISETARFEVKEGRSILDPGDGSIWVATEHGIERYAHTHNRHPPVKSLQRGEFTKWDGLVGAAAFNVVRDREGSIWVATTNGLDRFRTAPFRAVDLGHAVPVQLPQGRASSAVVVATDHLIDVSTGSPVSISAPFDGTWARSLFRSNDETLWVGTTGHLLHFVNGKLSEQSLPPKLRNSSWPVLAITEDDSRGLWISVGSGNGLFRFDGRQWLPRGGYSGLPSEPALLAERDHAGGLWFGFRSNRLMRIRSGQLDKFERSSGLRVGDVKAFAERGEDIWVGGDDGVAVLKGRAFYPLSLAGGASLRGVTGLAVAPDEALWINQIGGVVRIAKADLLPDALTTGRAVPYQLFDYHDGLQGIPHPLLGLGSAWTAPDGKLYIANRNFLQWVDPLHVPYNDIPPPVWISSVRADKKEYVSPAGILRFKPNNEAVQVDYTATSLLIPDRVRFRYKLEGYDRGWIDAGSRRQAFYAKLPPGNYLFRVVASNDSGVWNNSGATVGFTVPPNFTQTIWFRVLWLSAIAGGIFLAYVLRIRQVAAQVRKGMYERLVERERIARDLHDTIFQGIQGLLLRIHTITSSLPQGDPIRGKLEETLQQSDQVMREGRELVLDLRTTASKPSDLPAMLANWGKLMQKDHPCAFEVIVNGKVRPLHPVVYEEILRIGKEALGNAFRHSVGQSIEAELNYEPNELRMCIRDDGVGIDAVILEQGGRENHWGLPGMRERARKIGACLNIWSRAEAGTEIELRLPARVAFARGPNQEVR